MEIFTTKMKIIIILIVGAVVCIALYKFFTRSRGAMIKQKTSLFSIPTERIHKEVLANGMHVLVFHNPLLPKVLVQIAYDVGSYVEESGERGLAHLVEHMIYKGTQTLSESDIDSIARKYGASFNAFTAMDMTSYYFEANKNNWKPFLPILVDCMLNARFDSQHLNSEVKAVIQELKMNKDNYWKNMIMKAFELVFPANHPYHTPIIGFKEDLLTINAESIKKFYKKYYRPDRATLFIVGDVDANEALTLAKKYFEPVTADKDSVIKTFPTIIPELVTHHTRYYEDVAKDQLGFYWIIPGLKAQDEHLPSALESLLGSGQSGLLVRLLVDERKVATSVTVKASKFMEAGVFLILIEPLPGKSEECQDLVQQELEKIIAFGVAKQDLERVAKLKSRKFFLKMQDNIDFVYNWIKSYFATKDEFDIFKRVDKYFTITPEQIQSYVKTHLDPFLMQRIEVLPLPESKRALRESIKKMSDDMDQNILARHVRTTPVEEPRAALSYAEPEKLNLSFPKPDKVLELANGLKIVLVYKDSIPLIACHCQLKDAHFLSEARQGIAVECMMDMLMEGSKGFTKKENVDFFEQRGAGYAFDEQGARFICLREDFQQLIQRFYHILHEPTFPTDAIEKLKKIFIDNYQRAKDSPRAMAARILKNEVYKDHPFAWTFDEAIHDVTKLDAAALATLHKTYVCPANMVMSVVGSFDVEAMAAQLKKVFESWPSGKRATFTVTSHDFDKGKTIDHYMMRDQIIFLMGKSSTVTIYDPDLIPLKLLNIICFRSLGSRIFKVREQTGLFYSAFGAFAAGAAKEHGYDYVGMIVGPDNMKYAEEQTRLMLETVARDGVTDVEIAAARQIYLKSLIDLITDNSAIAQMLCMLDSLDLGFDYYDKVLARVQSMGRAEINAIAAKYCMPDGMVRVRVGPTPKNNG